jgi:peptidase E
MTVYSRPVTQLRALPSLVLFLFILTMSVSLGNAMAAKKAVLISSFSGLSSSHFAQLVQALRPIDTQQNNNNKLLYVPTASYSKPLENTRSPGDYRRRCRYDAKQKAEFVRNVLGFDSVEMLEIDHADMTPTKIRDAVEEAGCIYVAGGNTFYLQKHIIRSQFWEGIKSSLERGCIYIGQSAGAIVAGPTIETAYWKGKLMLQVLTVDILAIRCYSNSVLIPLYPSSFAKSFCT